jgi:uncharacterized protein (DUF2235 family)
MAEAAARNLVVGLDGTWNDPAQLDDGKAAPTNVARFIALLKRGQRIHYEEGVGTGMWEAVRGGIYGFGLDEKILGAYRFLCERFADDDWKREDNKVFLLGFSRGAYAARRLSGLIAHSGIPARVEDTELGLELYKRRDFDSPPALKSSDRFFDIPVEMVGVWDTVKATNDADYHDNELSHNVAAGYHAMAIDEQRKVFPVLKWDTDPRVTQVWFAGVHADVGGGYAQAGLSDITLQWMVLRGLEHGLDFREKDFYKLDPRPDAPMHQSWEGIWKAFGAQARTIAAADLIHPSVAARMDKVTGYRPALPRKPLYWDEPYQV